MVKHNIDYLIDAKRAAGSTVKAMRIGKTGESVPITFKPGTNVVLIGGINAKRYLDRATKAKQRNGEFGAKSKHKSNRAMVLVNGNWKPLDAKLASKVKRTATWAAKR